MVSVLRSLSLHWIVLSRLESRLHLAFCGVRRDMYWRSVCLLFIAWRGFPCWVSFGPVANVAVSRLVSCSCRVVSGAICVPAVILRGRAGLAIMSLDSSAGRMVRREKWGRCRRRVYCGGSGSPPRRFILPLPVSTAYIIAYIYCL